MNTLDAMMRPVVSLINRQIRNKTPARELCSDLEGTIVAVRVRNTALAMYFLVERDALEIRLPRHHSPPSTPT